MSDKTWARIARFAFWLAVWGLGTLSVAVGLEAAGWGYGKTVAHDTFQSVGGILWARYFIWHERLAP